MKKRYPMGAFFLACVLAIGMFGCAKSTPTTTDPEAQNGTRTVLRRMYDLEARTLNHLYSSTVLEAEISTNVIDGLVEHDPYGVIRPSLAESWTPNEDFTVWTFHIRPGVQWVDYQGNPVAEVTAQDWVDSAKWVNDASHQSSVQYLYDGVIKNAQAYYNYTAYLVASENGTKTTDAQGNPIEVVAPVDFSAVGVQAKDAHTLVYTMEAPTAYFPSFLTYNAYMPAYGPLMEEWGERFGTDHTKAVYNGAYILEEFDPQNQRIMVKNPHYWDAENVHIQRIEWLYNSSATTMAPEAFLRDEVDVATLDPAMLSAWQADEKKSKLVSPGRPDNSFTYFFALNFEPRFDERYEPDNWTKAINNENFRQSLRYGLDRLSMLRLQEPQNPEWMLNNTITPKGFVNHGGVDYTQYPALKPLSDGDSFDAAVAQEYKTKAVEELTAIGATFPIKLYLRYNPSHKGSDTECQLMQQQLEKTLGTDYLDVIVETGPTSNFFSVVHRAADFGMIRTTWGADYADPQTFTDPFLKGASFTFMTQDPLKELAGKTWTNKTPETQALVEEYFALQNKAIAIKTDLNARYTALAEAEAFLIDHAFVIPYSIHNDGYAVTRMDAFDGPYASYGLSVLRYKYRYVYDRPTTTEQFNLGYEQWKKDAAAAHAEK